MTQNPETIKQKQSFLSKVKCQMGVNILTTYITNKEQIFLIYIKEKDL